MCMGSSPLLTSSPWQWMLNQLWNERAALEHYRGMATLGKGGETLGEYCTLEKENDEQHPEMAFGWFCFSFVCKVKSHENIPSQFTLNISWLEECLSLNCRYNKGKMAYFVSLENLFLIHFLNCFRLQRNLYDIFSHSQSGPLTAASFYKRISK